MPPVVYLIMALPLAGILYSAYLEHLKFKEKLHRLGGADSERAAEYEELKAENERLARRVENLEAVVTSRLWSGSEPAASESERARLEIAVSDALAPEAPSAELGLERLAEGLRV